MCSISYYSFSCETCTCRVITCRTISCDSDPFWGLLHSSTVPAHKTYQQKLHVLPTCVCPYYPATDGKTTITSSNSSSTILPCQCGLCWPPVVLSRQLQEANNGEILCLCLCLYGYTCSASRDLRTLYRGLPYCPAKICSPAGSSNGSREGAQRPVLNPAGR